MRASRPRTPVTLWFLAAALLGLILAYGCPAAPKGPADGSTPPSEDTGATPKGENGEAAVPAVDAPRSDGDKEGDAGPATAETKADPGAERHYAQGRAAGGSARREALRTPRPQGMLSFDAEDEEDYADIDELLILEEAELVEPTRPGQARTRRKTGALGKNLADERRRPDAGRPGEEALVPPGFEAGQGSLLARDSSGETVGDFPLKHTDVKAEVSGFLASTVVRQTFTNPYTEPIEAVYVFPLPTRAAINDFLMQVGDRKIRGLIRPREEAERIYAEARARGQTASLLTQERPNIFTQNVANIEAGGEVVIDITYFHTLSYEKGVYEYGFPMVVGPRYIPGAPKAAPGTELAGAGEETQVGGEGTAVDTDQVPDASRISPPVLREGERSGHDISLLVDVDAGVPLGEVEVPTHDVHVERASASRVIVRLADHDSIPNRDFVLRYEVAGEAPAVGLLTHRSEESGGFFTLMLVPQLDPADADVTPREVTFVLDTSGSMSGVPIEMSKEIVRRTLKSLRPDDRFNIIRFAGDAGMLSEAPLENTEANVRRGLAYVDGMSGGGGTEMMKGVRAYLSTKRDPAFIRIVCFLTDGYVGDEPAILKLIRDEGQGARWFAFGIGSSVNRYLIQGIGNVGNGACDIVLPRDEEFARRATERFFDRIDAPVLVDIDIDYGELPIADLYPKKVNDLFTGQPIVLEGRYTGAAEGTITVHGRVGAREVAIPVAVTLPESEERNAALAPVWARQRIADLSRGLIEKPGDEETIRQITNLALEFRLVSAYTSFVAVDESRIVGDGRPVKILVPVEVPESVSREGAVGEEPVGVAVRVAAWGITLMEHADSSVRVVQVDGTGAAEGKVRVGERIATVGRTQIRGLRHLEALLLQASGDPVEIGLRPADDAKGTVTTLWLPRP